MHLSRALSALLAASVLTACASSAAAPSRTKTPAPTRTPVPESTVAPPLTDAQIARRGVLRQADFPAGWRLNRSTAAQIKCKTTDAARKAASATVRGKTFATGDNTEAESVAYVYRSVNAAKRQLNALGGRQTTNCILRAVKLAFVEGAGYKVGTIATAPLQLEAIGDERLGTRITIPISTKGVDADVIIDVVVVRTGRAFALELFVDAFQAFDEAFRAKLTATQVQRLSDAQQQ
jgi:hypothetical protein